MQLRIFGKQTNLKGKCANNKRETLYQIKHMANEL